MSDTASPQKPATFMRRAIAYTIDGLVFLVPYLIVLFVLLWAYGLIASLSSHQILGQIYGQNAVVTAVIFMATNLWIAAIAWFLANHRWQATPGKRLMGIYVVDTNGDRLTYKRAFLRSMLILYIVAGFNLLMMWPNSGYHQEVDAAQKHVLFDYFPDMIDGIEARDLSLQDYLTTMDGRQHYSNAFNNLTDEEQNQLMHELHEHTQEIEKPTLTVILPIAYWLVFITWYILALFTKEKTAGHDIIAKTRVVTGKVN